MPNKPDEPLRGTGRTTALMLRAIADAIENPVGSVVFEDHAPSSLYAKETHRDCLRSICNALGLQIEVGGRRCVWLKSKAVWCIEAHQQIAERQRDEQLARAILDPFPPLPWKYRAVAVPYWACVVVPAWTAIVGAMIYHGICFH